MLTTSKTFCKNIKTNFHESFAWQQALVVTHAERIVTNARNVCACMCSKWDIKQSFQKRFVPVPWSLKSFWYRVYGKKKKTFGPASGHRENKLFAGIQMAFATVQNIFHDSNTVKRSFQQSKSKTSLLNFVQFCSGKRCNWNKKACWFNEQFNEPMRPKGGVDNTIHECRHLLKDC